MSWDSRDCPQEPKAHGEHSSSPPVSHTIPHHLAGPLLDDEDGPKEEFLDEGLEQWRRLMTRGIVLMD